jgi:hypothetical protein
MQLYCWNHNMVHPFAPGEAERIVYALTGMLSTAESSEPLDNPPYGDPKLVCPREALALAQDSECYLEHVEQGVACRRAA